MSWGPYLPKKEENEQVLMAGKIYTILVIHICLGLMHFDFNSKQNARSVKIVK